jgi:hypothetical protein
MEVRMHINDSTATRFWAKVDKSGDCWEWTAYRYLGYGRLRVGPKATLAHRVSFVIAHGREPRDMVLHTCDNRGCVNPAHLYEGNNADNMRDRLKRGGYDNQPRGEDNPSARLTQANVLAIRADKRIARLIAVEYGITLGHVYQIRGRRCWAWLEG